MSSTEVTFDVPSFINSRRTGITQYAIVALCGLIMFLDGFDTQAISYMAPSIAKEWGLPRQLLGPIFSSALSGLMVGYLLVSPLSDRFGHRRLVVISTFAFALLTFATIFATNVTELMVLRFITGIALGSVIPSTIALTTEFSPARLRATFVLAIYSGFSLGFVAAGAVAAWVIPEYGWRSMLWIGAAAPMVAAILALMFLPESMDFLIRTKAKPDAVWRVVRRIDGALPVQGPTQFVTEAAERRSAVGSLFSSGRAAGTLVVWVVFMLNLAEFYALQSWLPSMLTNVGHSLNTVALATTMTTVGGIVAAFVIGPAMDRIGPYGSLATVYLVGAAFVVLFGYSIDKPSWMMVATAFCAGFCISGGQKSVIALATIYYPTSIRSTGVGWALGIGRLGGIGGPLLIGALLAYHLNAQHILYVAGIPMLIAGSLILLLGYWYGGMAQRAKVLGFAEKPTRAHTTSLSVPQSFSNHDVRH
ncbi:MFS transporter [Bradyrhizobium sp. LHD-71]|uniref:MFS transporter n=1 Tax=Bradyrhizobium sp. LHD-71 TaxID=3072141 RepID=UPI00280C9D19|nr:MFS transporter [Bradyrhizobium sp. LHD-71]MDQ8727617.1 MFS transporter [Bradyrhizobium sp. LHD-71]